MLFMKGPKFQENPAYTLVLYDAILARRALSHTSQPSTALSITLVLYSRTSHHDLAKSLTSQSNSWVSRACPMQGHSRTVVLASQWPGMTIHHAKIRLEEESHDGSNTSEATGNVKSGGSAGVWDRAARVAVDR